MRASYKLVWPMALYTLFFVLFVYFFLPNDEPLCFPDPYVMHLISISTIPLPFERKKSSRREPPLYIPFDR